MRAEDLWDFPPDDPAICSGCGRRFLMMWEFDEHMANDGCHREYELDLGGGLMLLRKRHPEVRR